MANNENLEGNGFDEITAEKQREIARQGGIASVEARRKKKLIRECLEELLEREIKDKNGQTMTGAEAMAVKVFQQALKGDLKAFEIVRDTAGQKPIDKVENTNTNIVINLDDFTDDD